MITPHLLFFFFNAGGGGGGTVAAYDFMADTPSSMAAWTAARGGAGGTGEATYFDSGGNLQVASAGQWRITHDPATGQRLGLLLEPGRSSGNGIRNPRMIGAIPGTPGTAPTNYSITQAGFSSLSAEVVAVGVENNMNYIDVRWYGTTNAGGRLALFLEGTGLIIPASIGQTFTHSIYAKIIAGTYPTTGSVFGVQENTAGVSTNALPLLAAAGPGTASNRLSACRLVSAPHTVSTAPTNAIRPSWRSGSIGSGVAVDVTIRFAAPQTELGTFATMPMLPPAGTTGATTRAADAGHSLVSVPSAFSMFSEQSFARFRGAASGAELRSLGVSDGTSNNRAAFRALDTATPSIDMAAFNGGVSQADFSDLAAPVNTIMRQAAGYAANDFAYSANGGAIAIDTSGTLASLDRLNIEAGEAVTHLRHLILYGSRLSNAELVALSTSGVASEIVDFIIRVRRRRRRR